MFDRVARWLAGSSSPVKKINKCTCVRLDGSSLAGHVRLIELEYLGSSALERNDCMRIEGSSRVKLKITPSFCLCLTSLGFA